ncbi:MAG: hypothetical protein JST26_03310 [Bacteroidetes bacterium]|nr:hypothetical protein [Bacteroidota bacterium]
MKYLYVFYLCLWLNGFATFIYGQTTVICDDYLISSRQSTYRWQINGISFKPAPDRITIYPHYPDTDTIVFFNEGAREPIDTIYSRIPPGKNYVLTIGCCDEGFDIYDASKLMVLSGLMNRHDMDNATFDSLYMASKESGEVKFVIHNKVPGDTLLGIYMDFAGLPEALVIKANKSYDWMKPSKGYYSSSIDYVGIARRKSAIALHPLEKGMVCWEDPDFDANFETLRMFRLRIFNEDRVIVDWDHKTNRFKLSFLDKE